MSVKASQMLHFLQGKFWPPMANSQRRSRAETPNTLTCSSVSLSRFLISALLGQNPAATQLLLHATSRCRRFRWHRDMRYTVTRSLTPVLSLFPPLHYLDKTTQSPDSLDHLRRWSTSRRHRLKPHPFYFFFLLFLVSTHWIDSVHTRIVSCKQPSSCLQLAVDKLSQAPIPSHRPRSL